MPFIDTEFLSIIVYRVVIFLPHKFYKSIVLLKINYKRFTLFLKISNKEEF